MTATPAREAPAVTSSAVERVRDAYARIDEVDRPEVWITLRDQDDAIEAAAAIDARVAAGETLPLAGATLAVKDNIHVGGLPTTAGCPAFAETPAHSAAAVSDLVEAGAVVIGKTSLDQFATGLTGTRSPHGPVRDARRPDYVSGGSSSGSAVAVALGIADLALATDTAGSGRVPAAFQGIVGIKPTRGLVSLAGVVPACRSFDCVSLFAPTLEAAERAFALVARPRTDDTLARRWPRDAPLGIQPPFDLAIPSEDALDALSSAAQLAFADAAARLAGAGATLVTVDISPLLEAGRLLYGGAFVAERYAAVGAFARAHPEAMDPIVAEILGEAGELSAHQLVADTERLDTLRARVGRELAGTAALLLPTAPAQPTIAAVAAAPRDANDALGIYTTATNLLDLCAVSVPAGTADGGCFGVSVLGRAFADRVCADIARMLADGAAGGRVHPARAGPEAVPLLVVGAHLSGQPLNGQLTAAGAVLEGSVQTSPEYRLHRLDTDPPKPGLVRVARGGAEVAGELWLLSPAALGDFLAVLPRPMALTQVLLSDGRDVVGFTCEAAAIDGAPDITAHGGWRAYLASAAASSP